MSITSRSCDIHILVLLLLIVKATASSNNETSQEHRQSRVTGRIVKLYSGTRPEPVLCAGEGFQADPRDCAVFYRCMKSGKGKYTVFRFQCGPGTVYDPETEVCNHPRSTKRSECGGFSIPLGHIHNNEIERNQNEIPSPITNKPVNTDKPKQTIITEATLSTGKPWVASSSTVITTTKRQIPVVFTVPTSSNPWVSSSGQTYIDHEANRLGTAQYAVVQNQPHTEVPKVTTPAASSASPHSISRDNNICTSDGFMGDTENCRKFYRCVANQRGTYTRYEFSCSETTVWDDDTQSCNHAWAVKRSRCSRSNEDNPNNLSTTENIIIPQKDSSKDKNIQQQLQISHGSKVTQTQTQISNGSVVQNQTQINYGDRINQNKDTKARQNQTQISHGSAVSQTQTQIDYSNKGVQTQLQIDHSQQASQTQVQVHESTTSKASSISDLSINYGDTQGGNKCQTSGFMGDLNDCKKFYRCIDNGRGGYTKFEFTCGEGTVWDQNIEACNHAWAVRDCGVKASTVTTSTTAVSTPNPTPNYQSTVSTENYHSTLEVIETEDNEDSGYGQQNQGTTPSSTTLNSTTTKSPSKGDCQSSGFIGDANDCKIFYRCVENGKGSFTKYEFKCGEGTVWDPELEACNHAWAVKHCGSNTSPDTDKTEITTEKHSTPSSAHTSNSIITQSTTESAATQSDDYDTGYGPAHNDFTPATTTTTTKQPQNIEHSTNNDCQSSGFLGDKNDCKKFYRCVDNGNGGYTRYEFTCGEGTVWDSKIEACNHAWAVETCGGSSQQEATTEPKPVVISSSSTESIPNTVPTLIPSTTYSSTSIVTESVATGINGCTHSGFMGDQKDCKKFYRCVDNGKGSFTKYEFSCGEGTVWDQKIEACNHIWAVQKCGGTSKPSDAHHESTTQYHPTMSDEIDNGYPSIVDAGSVITTQSTTTYHTTEGLKETGEGTNCINSGFIGDKNDCKIFYRCVDDGKGGFIRYEFTCGEGTLWDQSIEACNHEWAVKNCGKSANNTMQISNESSTQATSSQGTDQGYLQNTEKTSTSTIVSTFPDTELNNLCTKDGFIGDSNNCKKFYRCVDNGQGGFTKYEFTCGEGTYWNQEILSCDHTTSDKTCPDKESGSSTQPPQYEHDEIYTEVTSISSTSTVRNENETQKPVASSGICTSEGFYGDLNDCKKFYRCVNDGKGSYIKYDFTCGDGTIWDQEIQTCNHESSNKNCSSSFPPDSNVSQTTESQPAGGNNVSTTTTPQIQHTIPASASSTSSSQCTSEGFFADPKDCKKFIRCVSNDKGGYTKYEFTCSEGTVWVQDILACDHDTGDTNCSSQNASKPHTTERYDQTTQKYNPNISEPQTIDKQEDEYDNGNLNPVMHDEDNTPSTETSSTMKTTTSDSNTASGNKNICNKEGYFGDTQDCKKFYRCVDNGKGGYTKYDFTCGEGTIWDQDVTTCNHPQDVVNPSCNQNQDGSTTSTTAPSSTSSAPSSTSSSSSISQTTTTTTEGTQTSSNCSQEETSKKPVNQNITCDKGGYYPNPNDCKKFYRCVDWDGDGKRFSVYHFECGEGTIWDPAVETCNHEESVYPPRDCSGSQSQNVNESSTTEATTASQTSPSESTTTEKASTSQSSTQTGQSTTTEQSTTQQSTTSEQTTTQQSTTSEQTTTQQSTTSEQTTTQQSTTSEQTTTQQSTTSRQTTTQQSTTFEGTTTQQSTTSDQNSTPPPTSSEQTTTQQSTTSDQTTTLQSTTSELTTTTQQSTTTEQATSEQSTQQPSTSENTTSQQSTTSEQTTQQPTVSEPTTSEQSTTSQQTTTEQSPATEQTTTQESTSSQQTTQASITSEQTTQTSTTTEQLTSSEQTTTELSTTSESTTDPSSSTTEPSTTEQSTTSQSTTTEQSEQNTTEISTSTDGTTTESSTGQSTTEQTNGTSSTESSNKCPETSEDQNLFVCPTSFRRHPKYCNLFYQCDETDDTHDLKIAVFTCPNNTIYDETQTRCVEESKSEKKCNGKIAQRRRFKRLDKDYREPIVVTTDSFSCPSAGYYSLEKDSECSPAFLKCKTDKQNKLSGLVYQCPTGYIYWKVSKRCEPMDKVRDCKRSHNDWTGRWEIPVERRNVASM